MNSAINSTVQDILENEKTQDTNEKIVELDIIQTEILTMVVGEESMILERLLQRKAVRLEREAIEEE